MPSLGSAMPVAERRSRSTAVWEIRNRLGKEATRERVDAELARMGLPPSHGNSWNLANRLQGRKVLPVQTPAQPEEAVKQEIALEQLEAPEPVITARRGAAGPNLGGFLELADLTARFGVGTVSGWMDVIKAQTGERDGR